ncbi:MAG: hypothetical protein WKF84_27825 [Pyrinomonadaceae bacterium]
MALKILSLTLVEQLKTLDEGHNLTDSTTLDFFEIVRRFEIALIKARLSARKVANAARRACSI